MSIRREWVTPVTIAAFLISAATGVAIFFHIDSGLVKPAHEWLSWLLLGAVAAHVVANFFGFKRYFASWRAWAFTGLAVLIVAGSFAAAGIGEGRGAGGPPFMKPVRALARAPLSTLAQVAGLKPEQLRERLAKAHVQAPTSDTQSLADLVGPDGKRQLHVMGELFSEGE